MLLELGVLISTCFSGCMTFVVFHRGREILVREKYDIVNKRKGGVCTFYIEMYLGNIAKWTSNLHCGRTRLRLSHNSRVL
ncbi:hypothetical protein ES702_05667 [subsurface metagenome]